MIKLNYNRKKGLGPLCQADEFADSFISNMVWYALLDEMANRHIELEEGLKKDPNDEDLIEEQLMLDIGWKRIFEQRTFEA